MLSEIGVALGLCCLDFDVYSCKPCTAGLHFTRFLAFETKPHTQVSSGGWSRRDFGSPLQL